MTNRMRVAVGAGLVVVVCLIVALVISTTRRDGRGKPKRLAESGLATLAALETRAPGPLVTPDEIVAAGDGPAGTILRWWRDIQFNASPTVVASYYSPAAHVSAKTLKTQLKLVGYLIVTNTPRILDVQDDGHQARVFALIGHGDPNASYSSVGTTSSPRVMVLTRVGPRWLLADNRLLADDVQTALSYRTGRPSR